MQVDIKNERIFTIELNEEDARMLTAILNLMPCAKLEEYQLVSCDLYDVQWKYCTAFSRRLWGMLDKDARVKS